MVDGLTAPVLIPDCLLANFRTECGGFSFSQLRQVPILETFYYMCIVRRMCQADRHEPLAIRGKGGTLHFSAALNCLNDSTRYDIQHTYRRKGMGQSRSHCRRELVQAKVNRSS